MRKKKYTKQQFYRRLEAQAKSTNGQNYFWTFNSGVQALRDCIQDAVKHMNHAASLFRDAVREAIDEIKNMSNEDISKLKSKLDEIKYTKCI